MPYFLKALGLVGTAAMIWVGGGIIVHGLATYGLAGVEHVIHALAVSVGSAVPALDGILEWGVTAAGAGVVGLVVGFALIPLVSRLVAPLWKAVTGGRSKPQADGAAGHH